jgi:uncharacterized protein YhbP (UPF0306 family)
LRQFEWTVHCGAPPTPAARGAVRSTRLGRRWSTAIERAGRRVAEARLRALAEQLLDASTLCAIATTARGGIAHVNTAYFARTPDWTLVWLSEPRATHSRNIGDTGSAAIAVFDSRQTWGKADRGIQTFGRARMAAGAAEVRAREAYRRRFREYREEDFAAYRLYELRPRRLKLFDEETLGAATFVTAKVDRGGRLIWERTEIYDSTR